MSGCPSFPAVRNNLERLASLFIDPAVWGIAPGHCTILHNPATVDEVLAAVNDAASGATDTLLVYFSGHGLLDSRTSRLHRALREAANDRLFKAVRYDDLRRLVMDAERCARKIVLLDCCYSGGAIGAMNDGWTQVADQSRIEGTYVMTASSEYMPAMAPEGAPFTAFTGELVAALEHGLPQGPPLLDVDTLYFHLRSELIAKGFPVPQQRAGNGGRQIVLARNRFGVRQPTAPESPVEPDLPAVPAGFDGLMRERRPARLAEEISRLADLGQTRTGDALLAAIASRRDGQEVAALVDHLHPLEDRPRRRRPSAAHRRRGGDTGPPPGMSCQSSRRSRSARSDASPRPLHLSVPV